jgi:hypothetical protein
MVQFLISELWDFIHQIVRDFKAIFHIKAHGLKGYRIVRLVIFFALKVNIYLQIMSIKRLDRLDSTKNIYFHCILCAASLIMFYL